jgi:DNA repair protein RadC
MNPDSLLVLEAGRTRPATRAEILSAARTLLSRTFRRGAALTSPRLARDYLVHHYALAEHETFVVLFLDNRHRLIESVEMFRGTIDGASVHPREVVKAALAKNAAAVILAHNHPSGVAEPSQADEVITARLREALGLVDIRVVDHLIVGGDDTVSLAERGLV